MKSENKPYVKNYDNNGNLTNPIEKSFVPMYPNREERRQNLQKSRFHGESGNVHLTVLPTGAYKRVRQLIKLASKKLHAQKTKTIDHYRLIHKSVRDQKVELVNP